MKKTFYILAILFSFMMLYVCSTTRNLPARALVEEGSGYSMKKDVAFNMAVTNALAKISNEHKVEVATRDNLAYKTVESSDGKVAETYHYETGAGTNSRVTISGYEVVSREYNYIRSQKQWECKVSVSVDSNNLE